MKIVASAGKIAEASQTLINGLLSKPAAAAQVMGHIAYFDQLRILAEAMEKEGDKANAVKVMEQTLAVMKKRGILASVIEDTERRLKRRR